MNKVHRFGVLAEFRVVGDFVSIICHRRIEIEGVAPVQAKIIMVNVRHHDELGPDPLSAPEADTAAATPAASSSSSASPSPSSSARPPYTYEISAYTGMIRQSLAEFLKSEEMQKRARSFTTPFVELSVAGHLCDYAASLLSSDPDTLQDVLSTLDLRDRCYKVVTLCQHEQRTEAARRRLREKVAVSPDYGSEYMKGQKRLIERTLGGKDNRQAVVQRFLQRLEGRTVPPAVRKVIDEEAEKLGGSDNEGSEYSITRNYLDWLTSIPYGVYSAENRDIAKAEQILDADHYGMLDIKQRILEFIATTSRAGREAQQGKIICLTGAPGVGKCWAAGTQLRLMDGQLKAVEKFTGGELLMGDDGSARLVVAGSLTRGRAVLYRIRPSWDGASAFTVNGDHILVLVNAVRPHVAFDAQLRRWETRWFELDTDNEMSQRRQAADSEEAAEEEASRQQRLFAPLEWEVSVDQFMHAPAAVREACKLFQSAAVSFQSSLPGLQSTLSELLGTEPAKRSCSGHPGTSVSGVVSARPETAASPCPPPLLPRTSQRDCFSPSACSPSLCDNGTAPSSSTLLARLLSPSPVVCCRRTVCCLSLTSLRPGSATHSTSVASSSLAPWTLRLPSAPLQSWRSTRGGGAWRRPTRSWLAHSASGAAAYETASPQQRAARRSSATLLRCRHQRSRSRSTALSLASSSCSPRRRTLRPRTAASASALMLWQRTTTTALQ